MTKPSPTIEKILKSFRDRFTEAEGFGGIGGSGTRTVFKWPDNPDFRDEVLIDDIELFLVDKLQEVESQQDKEYQEIFNWLLGYTTFPKRKEGEGMFWWRKELREKVSHLKSGEERSE